jgi:chromosomal replication initiation ATPase DnaA
MSPATLSSLDRIVGLVITEWRVSRDDLFSRTRRGPVAEARKVATYLCHRYAQPGPSDSLDAVLPEYFRRDRTTVAWAVESIATLLTWDKRLARRIAPIADALRPATTTTTTTTP